MKFIGLLVCLCFLVLAVSAGPPQEGTGTAGTITQAIPLAQVSGNSTPPNGPSDPAEVEAFFDRVMPGKPCQVQCSRGNGCRREGRQGRLN